MPYRKLASIIFCLTASYDISGESLLLDGVLSPSEWDQANSYDLEYELMPSRNTPAALKTTAYLKYCLLYTSPSPRDKRQSRMPSSA